MSKIKAIFENLKGRFNLFNEETEYFEAPLVLRLCYDMTRGSDFIVIAVPKQWAARHNPELLKIYERNENGNFSN